MYAQPSAATGKLALERRAAQTIRAAVEQATLAGMDHEDIVEIVDAKSERLPLSLQWAGSALSHAALYLDAPVQDGDTFRPATEAERGALVLALPELKDWRWCDTPPETTTQTLIVPVPAPRSPVPGEDLFASDKHYQAIVQRALDAHVATYGPVRALVEYPQHDLQGLTGNELQERATARRRRFNAAHPLPDDCPDCGNTLDRDDMCDRCRRHHDSVNAYDEAKEAIV